MEEQALRAFRQAVSVLPPAGGKQVIAVISEDGKAFARYTLCFDHG